jgi:uncharacterized repeat protein (TIGR01451 family)
MSRRIPAVPLLLALLLFAAACFVTGISGPTVVSLGGTATYDIAFETDSANTNGTAYVFLDVPIGWTVTAATYDATVNGSATSGNATTGVFYSGTACAIAPGPAEGYQRVGFSATFPTVTAADSGVLHVTFSIAGEAGTYTLTAFGGGYFGGPAQQCNAQNPQTLGVTVTESAVPFTVAKDFADPVILPGATTRLTVRLVNTTTVAITGVSFTDAFPSGLSAAAAANLVSTCSGVAGSTATSVSLTGGTIPASGSCTVAVNVTAATPGTFLNEIAAGAVSTANAGPNVAAATATLEVSEPGAPPTVAKSFAPAAIAPGETSRLTITLSNPNPVALIGASFTDNYPAGLVNAAQPNVATSCGGSVTLTAGSVSLASGTIPASGACTVSVDVTAANPGQLANDIAAGAVTTADGGANTVAATTAILMVTAQGANGIPTLGQYALMMLAGLLALLALRRI